MTDTTEQTEQQENEQISNDNWEAIMARRRVLSDPRLKTGPKALFCFLLEFSYERRWQYYAPGSILISVRTLARMLNASEHSINSWKKKLLGCGLIWVSSQHYRNMFDQNIYHVSSMRPRGVSPEIPESVYAGGGIEGNGKFRGKFHNRAFSAENANQHSENADFAAVSGKNAQRPVGKNGHSQLSKVATDSSENSTLAVGKSNNPQLSKVTTDSGQNDQRRAAQNGNGQRKKTADCIKAKGQGSGKFKGQRSSPPPDSNNWVKKLGKLYPRELKELRSELLKQKARVPLSDQAAATDLAARIEAIDSHLYGGKVPSSKPAPVVARAARSEPKPATEDELLEGARYLEREGKAHLMTNAQRRAWERATKKTA